MSYKVGDRVRGNSNHINLNRQNHVGVILRKAAEGFIEDGYFVQWPESMQFAYGHELDLVEG